MLQVNKLSSEKPPVITIDGPGGVGKGTVGRWLAELLNWNFLDSGCLYRALAIFAEQESCPLDDPEQLARLADHLQLHYKKDGVVWRMLLGQRDISDLIYQEIYGKYASRLAVYPIVRNALLQWQWNMRTAPGLVADGRDMGTIVFPDASLKFFLDATPEERAKRRYGQLKEREVRVSLSDVLRDVIERDLRDRNREVAPLRPAVDAIVIDTTPLTVIDVFSVVQTHVENAGFLQQTSS